MTQENGINMTHENGINMTQENGINITQENGINMTQENGINVGYGTVVSMLDTGESWLLLDATLNVIILFVVSSTYNKASHRCNEHPTDTNLS